MHENSRKSLSLGKSYKSLIENSTKNPSDEEVRRQFEEFRHFFMEQYTLCPDAPIFRKIQVLTEGRDRASCRVLDHGCGGGFVALGFLLLGYRETYGVDIASKADLYIDALNRILRVGLELPEPHFYKYDGRILPFPDGSFDIAYSVTVLEHVDEDCIEDYYREGRRVLRSGGIRFDTLPHRIQPYDTHARLWFVHYLPRSLQKKAYDMLRPGEAEMYMRYLHLRGPGYHERMMRRYYDSYRDESFERVLEFDGTNYKGPKTLRRVLQKVVTTPVFRPFARTLTYYFFSLDTVAGVSC